MITITKVVTKNFLVDFLARLQNIFGMNLTGYEKMIDTGIEKAVKELNDKGITLEWYRFEITQLTNGAVAILLYGDEAK